MRVLGIVTTSTPGPGGEFVGALDLCKIDRRVVRALEPVKPPVTPVPEPLRGQHAAFRPTAYSPLWLPRERLPKLSQAAVLELADATAGDDEVELVRAEVYTRVGGLHDHCLAHYHAGGEYEPSV